MTIYRPDGEPFMDIEVDDESYHYAEIMGRDDVTLYFSLPHFVDFPIGCYIIYQARTYTLYSVDKMRMEHRRDYEYTIIFESAAAELDSFILTLVQAPTGMWGYWRGAREGDFKFPYAASSQEHLRLIADCMTLKTGVTWSVGSYVDGGDKLISYDTMTCLDALKQIANTFETEYSIVGHTINLGKVEHYTSVAQQVTISYGKGNGLRPGVEKVVDTSEKTIGKVYVQGGDRNIDPSKYGSPTLHLPTSIVLIPDPDRPGQTIPVDRYWWYDGHTVSATEFEGARRFSCPTGSYIVLAEDDVPISEGALDLSEIYPHYTHYVTDVEEEDAEKNWWNIYSNSFTTGQSVEGHINYDESIIKNDEDLYIIFQTGDLAGRQFGVQWATKEDPEHEGEMIAYMKIVPSQQDGLDMPSSSTGFVPDINDTFMVFNCYLPNAYIQTAEMEMLNQALSYLWERMSPRFSIKGEIDPIWSSSRWVNIGDHFKPGAYFRFIDPTWENEGVSIRISNVKTYINKPHQPIVEMMSGISRPGVSTILQKVQAEARVVPESYNYTGRSFTKRSFADAKETMELLIKAGLEGFEGSIRPIAVQTMQLLVGSEQLQFLFFDDASCTIPNSHPYNFNTTTKKVVYDAVYLQHQTLDISDIRSSSDTRLLSDYKIWSITSGESAVLDSPETAYYLYVKCDADNDGVSHNTGEFFLSPDDDPMPMGPVTEVEQGVEHHYYYFLAAIINAEREGARSDAPLFGFTEVLPGQITTDVIRGSGGTSWWDLRQNQISVGGKLSYSPANGLVLNGALVQTGNGDTTIIGAWCGAYTNSTYYQKGDEVYWTDPDTNVTSTYIYIANTRQRYILPSNTNYWQVMAQGVKGEEGNGIDDVIDTYWSEPVTDGQSVPTGSGTWQSQKPQPQPGKYIWKKTTYTFTDVNKADYITYSTEYCAAKGVDGPLLVGRGNYDTDDQGNIIYDGDGIRVHQIYYGTETRRDVVYYDGRWYMSNNVTAITGGTGQFSNQTPPTSSPYSNAYWTSFEGNFSNVATGLLYAARAYIDKGYVSELLTNNQNSSGYIRALGGTMTMYDATGIPKLLVTGKNLGAIGGTGGNVNTIRGDLNASRGVIDASTEALATFSIASANNKFTIPSTNLIVQRSSTSYEETMTFSASFRIDGEDVTGVNMIRPVGSSETQVTGIIIPGITVTLPEGQHTLTMYVRAELPSLSYVRVNAFTATVAYNEQAVEIGANGMRIAFSPTIYAEFIKDTSGNNNDYFVFRNGNYGFRISSVAGPQRSNNMNVTNPTWTTLQ